MLESARSTRLVSGRSRDRSPPEAPYPEPEALGEILSFGFWMEKQGYRPHTVCSAVRSLKSVARNVNLLDSEAVKGYLASARFSPSRKEGLADHLARFYRYKNIPFQKPHYKREDKVPFIPLESEIDQLIAGSTSKVAAFLQLLKETGMRPGEAWNLKWTDIDTERNSVNVTPAQRALWKQIGSGATSLYPSRSTSISKVFSRFGLSYMLFFRRRSNERAFRFHTQRCSCVFGGLTILRGRIREY